MTLTLIVDIGNTDAVFGLYQNHIILAHFRISTHLIGTEEYEKKLNDFLETHQKNTVEGVMISSVVPNKTEFFVNLCQKTTKKRPILLTKDLYPALAIKILNPDQIGTDLVCNAVMAYEIIKNAVIVVDFGTALTFTTLSKEGEILGVSISPGLKIAIQALFQKTAQLHEIPLELPPSILGKDTTTALQSGVLWGYVGLVKGMISEIQKEVGLTKVVATGGLSHVLHPLKNSFDIVDKNLTMNGLEFIYQQVK